MVNPSPSAEVMATVRAAQKESTKLRFRLKRLMGLYRAYRKVLLDENGDLGPEARTVLADLIDQSGLGKASPELDPQVLAMREGSRRIVLHIFGSLKMPDAKLNQLERDLSQIEEE